MTDLAPPLERTHRQPPRRPQRAPRPSHSAARRTLLALLAGALGIVPLKGLFSDSTWLIDVWVSMLVVIGPAVLIRLRRAPGALDIWPGIVLLVPWLTARFLHDSAVLGFIPTGETWTKLSALMSDLHETTREEVAPIHTTVAVRLVICALLGLLAALVDLIAVVGRRGALAGVPLLVVYTVSGAVPRQPVAWGWFAVAAVAFLLLLAVGAGDDLEHWGSRVHGGDGRAAKARTALAVSTPRIAAAAIAAAVLLPLLVPGEPRNLLADAFHNNGGSSDGGGFGATGGNGGSISPFSKLQGELNQPNPRKLADVHMISQGGPAPYNLRLNVLSNYSNTNGWRAAAHGEATPIANGQYPVQAGGSPDTVGLEARIKITGMRANPPVFGTPENIDGLGGDTTWSSQDQLLLGSRVDDDVQFTERFQQPSPSIEQLSNAPDTIDPAVQSQLTVPADFPSFARNVVQEQITGKATQYAKARAIFDYFALPENGFAYDTKTKEGDSGDLLVDFLQNRVGFCQQYAAAMGIMLRVAGVPARVVLGYMHSAPDRDGNFSVLTSDAHAWVEAWFEGIGWIPFDPTPAAGLSGGANQQAWAPHDAQAAQPSDSSSAAPSTSSKAPSSSSAAPSSSAAAKPDASDDSGSAPLVGWVVGGGAVVVLLGLLPAGVRWSRRRQRYLAARRGGDADLLWDELSDTAVDLGYVWSASRSPRQVATWLAKDAPGSATSLQVLAAAVEQRRYAAAPAGDPAGGTRMVDALREVTVELRSARSGRTRLRARFWPASLRWTSPFGWSPFGGEGRRRL